MKFDLKRLFLLNNLTTALLPIICIGVISIAAVKSHVVADHDQNSALLAKSIAGQINTYLREPVGTFTLLTNHLKRHDYTGSERSELLSLLAESYGYFDAIYLLDGHGIVRQAGLKTARAKESADYLGMDFSGIEVCRDARSSGRLRWAPSVSIASGEPTMSFCAPLDGGTMLADLKLSDLGTIINESSSTRVFTAFIIDKSGRVIAHPDQGTVNRKENVGNLQLFRSALGGKVVTANFSLQSVEYRGTALLIPELGWVLVVAQELKQAMAPVHTLQRILISGLLATVFLAMVLGQIGSRMLRRPFDELTEIAHRVIREDYASVRSVPSFCEEICILSDTLCRMVDAIRAREMALNEQTEELMSTEETLRELNMLLEEKVAERTASLEKAGEAMAALNLDLMQRSTALEDANRQLEAFAYTVSHDLRAPIRHAGSFASILLEEQGAKLDEEGRDMARRIVASCRQMEQLIAALLKFSRVALSPLNKTVVHPDKIVAEIIAELQGELLGRECEITVAELPECMADVILLRQVWANLLGNAVKYTKNSPVTRIEVGASSDVDAITYFVKDNGAGFDMADYGRLFGVFQRLHSSRDFAGT
ncbi:MAG TPA: cache domain-containing protein, partial [Geobacteraceae bacterium]|nr:cache domain-containing protein [Geobacteraceae bacterium]